MPHTSRHGTAVLALALLAAALPAQAANAPCFESDLGTSLGTGDDVVFAAVNLGFTFPYGGSNYTQVRVGTNGLVWLGNPAAPPNGCCAGTGAGLCAGLPQIPVLWTDLFVGSPGAVWFHAFPAGPGNLPPARAVVTWYDVVEFAQSSPFTLQLQLIDGGGIVMWYGPGTAVTLAGHTTVTGVSPGNAAPDPGSIDISASLPYVGTTPTIYEQFAPGTFDLAAHTIEFVPAGGSYLVLDRSACRFVPGAFQAVGTGCPPAMGNPNGEFYQFTGGGSLNLQNFGLDLLPLGATGYLAQAGSTPWVAPQHQITIGDDQTIQTPLPFAFPRPGGVTNTVGLCSNGYLWLDNSSTGTGYTPTVAAFLAQGATFCPYWTDLNPSAGGQVFADVSQTHALFTWMNVPEYGNAGHLNTLQVELFPGGRIAVRYQNLQLSAARNVLVGFSRGGNVPDPGNTVLPAAVPFQTGTGIVPMTLAQDAADPVIGSTYRLRAGNEPPATAALFLVLGTQPRSIDLTPLGMTGCTQYETLDATRFLVAAPPSQAVPLAIPDSNSLIGVLMRAQVAAFAPGVNPLGVAISNGGVLTVGSF